ncbi:MAG: hypothetical protein JXQ68_07085 [Campylobacterales bacterium]|nr:hypothetical protein [Campylobacterales bacterium]
MKFYHLCLVFLLFTATLFYLSATTPITPHEAEVFFTSSSWVSKAMHLGKSTFGDFFGLRAVFVLFGVLSALMFFAVSQKYFTKSEDVYLATVVFMFLPGTLVGATLANESMVLLFGVLLFIWLHFKGWKIAQFLVLFSLLFVHHSAIIIYVALAIYALFFKNRFLLISSILFIGLCFFFGSFIPVGGKPSGHFLENFGALAAVFSPFLFLFFAYSMYRILVKGEKDIIWYISFFSFVVSLMLSIRQKVNIIDFAPYMIIALLPMVKLFYRSFRCRLPQYRFKHKIGFYAVLIVMMLSSATIVFHKSLFIFFDDSSRHFAYKVYAPYWKAKELKVKNIDCYESKSIKERYQMRYYGISQCDI